MGVEAPSPHRQPDAKEKKEERAFQAGLAVAVVTTALLLSWFWRVPYIYTQIGFSAWAFVGHLVTSDDDLPGGWSNPDGAYPFPWAELMIKGLVFAILGAVALFVPFVRSLGGPP
jgi:hypothetical protein